MNTYLVVKWIHIMSSTVLLGTGFGLAFFMFFANRDQSVAGQALVARLVVRGDWWFTLPSVIVQPATGLWLIHLAGIPLRTPWLAVSLVLYVLAGACWLPVVRLQLRMAAIASSCAQAGEPLPPIYWHYARWWERLGYPAFVAVLVISYLMVAKPTLWS